MKNFDNRAHKIQCNHNFYTQNYFYLILVWDNLHSRLLFSRSLLASILDKSCSERDLVFDGAVIFIHYKTINIDSIINENNKGHNEKWTYKPDHPYRIDSVIVGGSGSGKTNTLLNLINEQHDIDKIYLSARDLSEPK